MAALGYSQEPERLITVAEYIEFDERSDIKHEYLDGRMWAMAGSSSNHSQITFSISVDLGLQLRDSSCRGFSSDMRVHVPNTELYSYPDTTIVCGEPEYNEGQTMLFNPTVIIEVLSPSTEARDRSEKWLRYQRLPSLRDYLMVAQEAPRIEHYGRRQAGTWSFLTHEGLEAAFELAGAPAMVRLADVYRNISFEPASESAPEEPQQEPPSDSV